MKKAQLFSVAIKCMCRPCKGPVNLSTVPWVPMDTAALFSVPAAPVMCSRKGTYLAFSCCTSQSESPGIKTVHRGICRWIVPSQILYQACEVLVSTVVLLPIPVAQPPADQWSSISGALETTWAIKDDWDNWFFFFPPQTTQQCGNTAVVSYIVLPVNHILDQMLA